MQHARGALLDEEESQLRESLSLSLSLSKPCTRTRSLHLQNQITAASHPDIPTASSANRPFLPFPRSTARGKQNNASTIRPLLPWSLRPQAALIVFHSTSARSSAQCTPPWTSTFSPSALTSRPGNANSRLPMAARPPSTKSGCSLEWVHTASLPFSVHPSHPITSRKVQTLQETFQILLFICGCSGPIFPASPQPSLDPA